MSRRWRGPGPPPGRAPPGGAAPEIDWEDLNTVIAPWLGGEPFADKIPLKSGFAAAGVRVVPGASARFGAHLGRGVTMMPSYVNIGARVGADTLVDTWATVGSCAQIGERVHLSGGVGIGGVLEPPQAAPVMVEDDAFVGSRCIVVEGARVRRFASWERRGDGFVDWRRERDGVDERRRSRVGGLLFGAGELGNGRRRQLLIGG